MPELTVAMPEQAGFAPAHLQRAYDLLRRWIQADLLPAATLCVGKGGRMVAPRFFGRQAPAAGSPPLREDALFLIASITKPFTATAVMILAERGKLALQDRVADYVPAFARNGKQDVRILHLLTHTSGLPDMLPNNNLLRQQHQPFSAFVEKTCDLPLQFPPGHGVCYQSMGIAMLAEIVHQITGLMLPEFLRQEIFAPLHMHDSSLGCDPARQGRVARIRVPTELEQADWSWNSPYWLAFGAPWGGMVTTPADLARFCQMMLNGGSLNKATILSPATVRAMTTNQLATMPDVPESERRCRPWGLGWRLNRPADAGNFGDLLGPRTFGHWGATGTLCWIDPDSQVFFILFTTQPLGEKRTHLAGLSNVVMAAVR